MQFLGENKRLDTLVSDEENELYTSAVSFYEISKFFLKKGAEKELSKALDIVRRRSTIIEPTEKTCLEAAKDAVKHELYAIDAIIFRSSVEHNAVLVTADKEFKGKNIKNIMFI